MTHYRSDILATLEARGFIDQCTDPAGLDALAMAGPVTAYIGFDCTASSLHVGSLVPIMMLRWLQRTGHRPIVLMGGGTTKVGDPSGKDETRQLLTDAQIAANMAGIRQVFTRFLEFNDGPTGAVMVRRGLALRGTLLPSRQQRHAARYLVVTEGALAGTRITLGTQPVLIGRADDSTLVLTDDYASTRHARLSQRGSDWYVEDLGSTNGTYLDRAKVTTAVRVPIGTPVHIGKTVIELRP